MLWNPFHFEADSDPGYEYFLMVWLISFIKKHFNFKKKIILKLRRSCGLLSERVQYKIEIQFQKNLKKTH